MRQFRAGALAISNACPGFVKSGELRDLGSGSLFCSSGLGSVYTYGPTPIASETHGVERAAAFCLDTQCLAPLGSETRGVVKPVCRMNEAGVRAKG